MPPKVKKSKFFKKAIDIFCGEGINFLDTVDEDASLESYLAELFGEKYVEDGVSFIESLKAVSDRLASFVDLEFTIDAEGVLVSLNGNFADGSFVVDFTSDGNVAKATFTLANGFELVIDYANDVADLTLKQNGEELASGTIISQETVIGSIIYKTVGAAFGDDYFDIAFYVDRCFIDGVLTEISYGMQAYDNGATVCNYAVKISGDDSNVTYDIYAEANGAVVIDAGVSLTAENNGAKTEYTLSLDFGKLILGTTPIYEEVYETDENGYIIYWDYVVVAYKTATLSGSTEITFSSER